MVLNLTIFQSACKPGPLPEKALAFLGTMPWTCENVGLCALATDLKAGSPPARWLAFVGCVAQAVCNFKLLQSGV